jgi:hypothetical protein
MPGGKIDPSETITWVGFCFLIETFFPEITKGEFCVAIMRPPPLEGAGVGAGVGDCVIAASDGAGVGACAGAGGAGGGGIGGVSVVGVLSIRSVVSVAVDSMVSVVSATSVRVTCVSFTSSNTSVSI